MKETENGDTNSLLHNDNVMATIMIGHSCHKNDDKKILRQCLTRDDQHFCLEAISKILHKNGHREGACSIKLLRTQFT